MWRDLKFAAQALAQTPLFTSAATVALGLAIGANGAIFGVVDALWFRPPGIRDGKAIVRVFATTRTASSETWSYPEYLDIRDRTTAFEHVAIRGRRGSLLIAPDGTSELLLVNVVSTNFFDALGVKALHGRLFSASDDRALEAEPGIVLGHAFWRDRFGANPSIIGTTVQIGRGESLAVTVLGGAGSILLGAIGGIMVPKFLMPEAMQSVSWVSPMAWGLEGFLDVLLRQGGARDVLPEATAMVAFGLAALLVAAELFRRRAD